MCDHPDCIVGPEPHEQFLDWDRDDLGNNRHQRQLFWSRLHTVSFSSVERLLERAYQQGVKDASG